MSERQAKQILIKKFAARHVDACLKYFSEATEKYVAEDLDGVALKAGKFVEAVTKALMIHGGKALPDNSRKFKAGVELRALEQLDSTVYSDIVRIVIPKACIFIFEIVNNRGGRHDAADIDANEMDARVVIPLMSWVLAEMVRFSGGSNDTDAAMGLIDELTNKVYPYFEDIDGRTYVNVKKASAPEIALLLLYAVYPARIRRDELIASIMRHGMSRGAAQMAASRVMALVDESNGALKLRSAGRQKAEGLLAELKKRT